MTMQEAESQYREEVRVDGWDDMERSTLRFNISLNYAHYLNLYLLWKLWKQISFFKVISNLSLSLTINTKPNETDEKSMQDIYAWFPAHDTRIKGCVLLMLFAEIKCKSYLDLSVLRYLLYIY